VSVRSCQRQPGLRRGRAQHTHRCHREQSYGATATARPRHAHTAKASCSTTGEPLLQRECALRSQGSGGRRALVGLLPLATTFTVYELCLVLDFWMKMPLPSHRWGLAPMHGSRESLNALLLMLNYQYMLVAYILT
jgi:hypothetical protein